jgi:hypothetical protein
MKPVVQVPARQPEVDDIHGLQQADGVEREALALAELSEMLFGPGEQCSCRPLAVGQLGEVGEPQPALAPATKGSSRGRADERDDDERP